MTIAANDAAAPGTPVRLPLDSSALLGRPRARRRLIKSSSPSSRTGAFPMDRRESDPIRVGHVVVRLVGSKSRL